MGDAAEIIVNLRRKAPTAGTTSQELALGSASNELVFAVVGHVGSGTSTVAELLRDVLSRDDSGRRYDVDIIKASAVLTEWAAKQDGLGAPTSDNDDLNRTRWLQDVGDTLRQETNDHSAVARRLALKIREIRAQKLGVPLDDGSAVEPDGSPRAYVLDSIRHPAEVELLHHIYGAAFVLVGIVCDEGERQRRITAKFRNAGGSDAIKFMERDAKAKEPYGQRVAQAFHLADFFVDNTEDRTSPDWTVPDNLSRLKKIVTRAEVVRPVPGESGMYAAHGAMMRSACLSRQVGAALVDRAGAIVATGANEAPRAGGGTYADIGPEDKDHRCAAWKGYCRNTREQSAIIDELFQLLKKPMNPADFHEILSSSRIGGLLEFSRAVHAEMEALLDAARRGVGTVGTTVYVTTFPCHYCARHLVGAGVREVQYIEPYPKSRALTLHEDAITTSVRQWKPDVGGNVLFRPFTGVAPRLFVRAFLKDRELKNRNGDLNIAEPPWATPWHLGKMSYAQLEAELGRDV